MKFGEPKNPDLPQTDPVRPDQGDFDYVAYVESKNFGEFKKGALDIATLLNSPRIRVKGESYDAQRMAERRKRVFDAFCSLCARANIELPELEPELYLPFVPEISDEKEASKEKKARLNEISQFVNTQIESTDLDQAAQEKISVIARFLQMFPDKFNEHERYGSDISTSEILAVLNKELVTAGCDPVRPDYANMKIPMAFDEDAPEEEKRLLIVDDDIGEIINSSLRLAGWPNVHIEHYHHAREYSYNQDEEKKQEQLDALSKAISERKPDIILMDQGLDSAFEGSDLIAHMRSGDSADAVLFVANTGGSDEKLVEVGAFSNFDKGKNLRGLRQAVSQK